MDETEQQYQLEAIPKVTDGDPSLKESVDDDVKDSTTRKSSCDDSNSENLTEICKANGTKKETNECDTLTDVIETLGGEVQEEKNNFDDELIEVNEDIKNKLKEICEEVEASEVNNSSVISVNNSNLRENSNHEVKNEENYKNELGALLSELSENGLEADQHNKPDLNENKESSGHIIDNIEVTEVNINIEKKINDTLEEQNSVKQLESNLVDAKEIADQEESELKADQEEIELKADQEEIELKADQEENELKAEQEESELKADQEENELKADQEENELKADQEESELKADQDESEPKADQDESEPKADQGESELKADQEESELKADQEESELKADQISQEFDSHLEVNDKDISNVLEPDLCQVDELIENSSEINRSVNQDKEAADNKSDEDLIKFSPLKLADLQNNSPIELSTEIAIETKTAPNSEGEQDNEKTETLIVPINEESAVCETNTPSETEATLPESEKESVGNHNKSDSIEDSVESQVNVSKSSEEQDEENKSKSENESNELVDTEMVNCGDIDQEEVNENESLKEKEIDRIQIEPIESDSKNETRILDILEDTLSGEETEEAQIIQPNEILGNEFSNNEPGNSAEETVTGYSTNLKDKEENCIIPDGGILKLADLQQASKETRKSKEENEILKPPKIVAVVEKPKTRAQDKKIEAGDASKLRPTRSAAKLAENKIRSLVANDLVFEEGTSAKDFEDQADEEDQENDEELTECAQCGQVKTCKFITFQNIGSYYFCSDACIAEFKIFHTDKELTDSEKMSCSRKCSQCNADIIIRNHRRLFWETMDFCDEDCLAPYQHKLASYCANCKGVVGSSSIGKYCVRFGFDIKQFCSGVCLEEYKKGLKVCSYCQKDISTGVEGFLAPVGSKNKFKDFCSQSCMEKYELMSTTVPAPEIIEECAVCSNKKPVQVQVELDEKTHKLCSEPCFAAFKFVNNITEGQCEMCRKYYDCSKTPKHVVRINFYDEAFHAFCSRTCLNVYILANRTIVPCNWCKIKKYDFDMIKQINSIGQLIMMCSISCLMSYRMSIKPSYLPRMRCGFCIKNRKPLYYLTMTDSSTRYFCNSTCVMAFQNCYKKKGCDTSRGSGNTPKPVGGPKRMMQPKLAQAESTCIPVISSVQSLASNSPAIPASKVSLPRPDPGTPTSQQHTVSPPVVPVAIPPAPPPMPPSIRQQIIVKPPETKEMKNKSILCKPYSHTKGVSCRPHPCMKETQTDQSLNRKFLIPIPVPIYVPAPMHMFATPFPVPVPFPLPIPVPIFIPTTRNSAKGIMKEIKKIQEKIPTDPFEAELLMMAEMVAGDKKQDPTDSESEDGNEPEEKPDGTFYTENVDTSNTFGDDMLQMALKMASELEEPAVDMESVLTSSTITTNTQPTVDPNKALYATDDPDQVNVMGINRGRKRSVRGNRNSAGGTPSKRGRRTSGSVDVPLLPPPEPAPPRPIEVEKPDANMCLKYTFGVNAWRHWVMQKNAELEKAALTNRKIKLFKPDLLQLTADELNFSLCLFVKEVRKPNGTEYAPDTIYYLCLGIQQYLFENGRIDNIFTDSYYEKFTDCLDEVAKKFAALYNDSQYIVTRVEEEHLWESKQLGAHSPHVLLSTLMFFNTKHFNLVTVEEHMQLSFSHIMKHWKRNPNTPGVAKAPGSRNVLLRFYPPQSALEANSRKKKVYEQQENEENPLRCPVKLYEFYLSKCPESVKTRNDVFYLLPERSCVPDSPVWYSTMALGKEPLMKMLHRVKMVKEINIALLTS